MSLQPELIDAKDKFIAVNDPFYEQDEELPLSKQLTKKANESSQKVPLILIARDMYVLSMDENLTNKTRKNKYLSRNKRLKRYGK